MRGYIEIAIIKNYRVEDFKIILEDFIEDYEIILEECQYKYINNYLVFIFNDCCSGYDFLAKEISEKLNTPILYLFAYEYFWGYVFYEKGKELDAFIPSLDYFEEIEDDEKRQEEIEKCCGNAEIIANYFKVKKEDIENYLQIVKDNEYIKEQNTKAYESDTYKNNDILQIKDFMKKLGFSFDFKIFEME